MAKYIDRDKILDRLDDLSYIATNPPMDIKDQIGWELLRGLHKEISEMPTADVEEVKHGEWLPVQYTYFGLKRYECSECKDDEFWKKRYLEHKENYCPNCGAKMDGGKEE